jgi:hypothetical protein
MLLSSATPGIDEVVAKFQPNHRQELYTSLDILIFYGIDGARTRNFRRDRGQVNPGAAFVCLI